MSATLDARHQRKPAPPRHSYRHKNKNIAHLAPTQLTLSTQVGAFYPCTDHFTIQWPVE